MKWTEEQWDAITKEGSNIIVSAGAGSGKTAVLSERVLRKVKEGVDIRNILILTFTNEAAGEMKERIRKKIKASGLTEQLEYIDAAYITTFDAYALNIVKKYHYLLNISKNISIIDASIINLVKEDFLEEIFLRMYEEKNPKFLRLVGDFTMRDDTTIKETILNINKSLDLKYNKSEYLDRYVNDYYNEAYIKSIFNEYFSYLKSLALEIEECVYALEGLLEEKLYIKVYDAYSVFFKPVTFNDLNKIKEMPRVQFRNIPDEAVDLKDTLKSKTEELFELSRLSEEEYIECLISTKDYVEAITQIIKELDKKLEEYKYKNEAFEFVDIAKLAIKLVKENEDIRLELKNTYNEILIDEYQDTNDLQEMFISCIENDNVYMVGDIKQSIYRFRNANPGIFKAKYDSYSKNIGGIKIDLLKNFRSREEVLANINEIFNLIMTEDIGGVSYQNNHAMVYGNMAYVEAGATSYDNNMEILKYNKEGLEEYSNMEVEAFTILKDIKDKVDSKYQVFDFEIGVKRDIEYRDFCIILDRGSDMPTYKKIFEYMNIPMDVYQDSDLVLEKDLLIIKNIISLILAIKNKKYDNLMRYYFVSIARSYVSDLSDREIFDMLDKNTFYNSEIYEKCSRVAQEIDAKTPSIVLDEIIFEFNFYENFIKVGGVEAAILRLDILSDAAKSAADLGFTIEDFRDYLDNMIKNKKEIKYKEARGVGNCVKIMNIHKSKGLEFPICYFAGFYKKFNVSDLKNRFMFDNKYGITTPYYKEGIGEVFTKTLIKNRYYEEEISEKIRLFYVALTRAKEKMIMVMPEVKKSGKVAKYISKEVGLTYRSFYDFLSSISINLGNYMRVIDINSLGLTKDYEFSRGSANNDFGAEKREIEFREVRIDAKKMENKHASKTINKLISYEEARTLEYGTEMHNILEMTDFKDLSISNKYIDNLRATFDFGNANIYQEYEFIYELDDVEYHGIIDLMLEYDNEIKIIDYKLKNIDDEAYIKQLKVYYDYIRSISDKKISLYLYSIIENKVKEVVV